MSFRKAKLLAYVVLAVLLLVWPVRVSLFDGASSNREHKFDVPKFSGRIVAEENIEWGNETRIIVPFEEIETWGDDGLLTFSGNGWEVILNARRPDPKTKWLVQHAEKRVHLLGGNIFRQIVEVRQEGDKFIAVSAPDKMLLIPLKILFALFFVIIMIACVYYFAARSCQKLEKTTDSGEL